MTTMEPIHIAAEQGQLSLLKKILRRNPESLDLKDDHGRTPLHYAAIQNHIDVTDLLLSAKAEINAEDIWGMTPLFACIFEEILVFDHTPMAELLISKGADIARADINGDTPLHMAALFEEAEIADLLIASGADVNAKNNVGDTPLHKALEAKCRRAASRLLLQPGIVVRERSSLGVTPFEAASQKGWMDIAEMISSVAE